MKDSGVLIQMNNHADVLNMVVTQLKQHCWLTHNFYGVEQDEIYDNLSWYSTEIQYILILDRNIFDYTIKSIELSHELHKSAIALVLYCQYLNITIEPNLAIYEKFQRYKLSLEEVNEEYKKFQYIDNSKKELVDFICGHNELELKRYIFASGLPKDFDSIDRLKDFTTFELGILKLCTLYFDTKINRKDKFGLFLEYCQSDFLISIPLIVYSIILFDTKSIKGIMKFKKNQSKSDNEQAIYNMTWDIYNINRYYLLGRSENSQKQYLFASSDKLLSKILRICIKISYGNFETINEYIEDTKNLELFKKLINSRINNKNIERDAMKKEFLYSEITSLKNNLFQI